jgi:hypothetical protein
MSGRSVDVAQLIQTEQQRKLPDESGLSRARPDAVIEFTFADGYPQLPGVDFDAAALHARKVRRHERSRREFRRGAGRPLPPRGS